MAYIRRIPSGLYQATVRLPNGKRRTKTNRLKSVVDKWARDLEAKIAQGDTRDPRAGQIKVADWHARVVEARVVEAPTKAKNASLWKTHCLPQWGDWPMAAVQRVDAQRWVGQLQETRRARHQGKPADFFDDPDEIPTLAASTIHDIVYLMSTLYRAAMKEHPPLVVANPFGDLDLPRKNATQVEFYERTEAEALYAAVERLHGPKWRTLVELGMDVGLRPGEAYGLHGHRVDWIRGLLSVVEVATRQGLREYPKSMKSNRTVPIPAKTLEGMSRLMVGRPRTALVFTAPDGGVVDDGNFRDRIWYPAVEAARLCGNRSPLEAGDGETFAAGECGVICDTPAHGIRRFPPRIMRHTAASWLVQAGVPLYDVQGLLGHESFATTTRYSHLAPDAHDKVIAAWRRRGEMPAERQPG
ncbi:tyrosine-type recombinase/integrase [Nonomuraea sp. SYSU D8015]|uniref:tyrosine-type recombinase/integrase n=1 Tax=Nonomuraea sp. SYSU D8015 TaxID=2593644 RepID=UPI0016605898|nr:site-specific integrase [Nonomuraea sp. SYSU D8015]